MIVYIIDLIYTARACDVFESFDAEVSIRLCTNPITSSSHGWKSGINCFYFSSTDGLKTQLHYQQLVCQQAHVPRSSGKKVYICIVLARPVVITSASVPLINPRRGCSPFHPMQHARTVKCHSIIPRRETIEEKQLSMGRRVGGREEGNRRNCFTLRDIDP